MGFNEELEKILPDGKVLLRFVKKICEDKKIILFITRDAHEELEDRTADIEMLYQNSRNEIPELVFKISGKIDDVRDGFCSEIYKLEGNTEASEYFGKQPTLN